MFSLVFCFFIFSLTTIFMTRVENKVNEFNHKIFTVLSRTGVVKRCYACQLHGEVRGACILFPRTAIKIEFFFRFFIPSWCAHTHITKKAVEFRGKIDSILNITLRLSNSISLQSLCLSIKNSFGSFRIPVQQ